MLRYLVLLENTKTKERVILACLAQKVSIVKISGQLPL